MSDPTEPARRAEYITPEDTPMRMTVVDYSWQHPPRKPEPNGPNALIVVIVAAACLTLLPGIAALVMWGML